MIIFLLIKIVEIKFTYYYFLLTITINLILNHAVCQLYKTAISKKIPIIIVINKADKLFQTQNNEDSDDSDNLMDTFKIQIEETKNKLYESLKKELNINEIEEIEYVCIDCILKYGLDDLLETIYNKFKNKLISDIDLDKIQFNKIQKENLSILVGNSIFLGNGSLDEIILDEAIYKSSIDIKELIIKYFGFYENKLKLGTKIYFFFERYIHKIWNKINKGSNTFPFLKYMVKKIFENFGITSYTDEKCTKIIIDYINDYFNINIIYNEKVNAINKNNIFKESHNLQNNNHLIKENDNVYIIKTNETKITNRIEINDNSLVEGNEITNIENDEKENKTKQINLGSINEESNLDDYNDNDDSVKFGIKKRIYMKMNMILKKNFLEIIQF